MTFGPTLLADLSGLYRTTSRGTSTPTDPPGGGGGSPLFAYSVRKVSSSYSGPCMKVLRVGPGNLADIGFDSLGALDLAALAAHLQGNDGLVQTWYNQGSAGSGGNFASNAYLPLIQDDGSLFTFGPFNRPALNPGFGPMVMNNPALARIAADLSVMAVIVPGTDSVPEHIVGFADHWSVRSIATARSSFRFKDSVGVFQQTSGDANALESDRPTRFGWNVKQTGQQVSCRRRIAGRANTFTFTTGWGSYGSGGCTLFGQGASTMFSGMCAELMIFAPQLTDQQTADIEAAQIAYFGVS